MYYIYLPLLLQLFPESFCHQNLFLNLNYSIVKDSGADLGVNFKIVQAKPELLLIMALFGISIYNRQIGITVLNYAVIWMQHSTKAFVI